jgi:hypothetical protein
MPYHIACRNLNGNRTCNTADVSKLVPPVINATILDRINRPAGSLLCFRNHPSNRSSGKMRTHRQQTKNVTAHPSPRRVDAIGAKPSKNMLKTNC